jgi:hypothetical protein
VKEWWNRNKVPTTIVGAIGAVSAVVGFAIKIGAVPPQYEKPVIVFTFVVGLSIALVSYVYRKAAPGARQFRKSVSFLLFKQEELHQGVQSLLRANSAGPFVKFAGIGDDDKSYHIFFSHKGDLHLEDPDGDYLFPAPLRDEAEPLMRVWYPIAQHLHLQVDQVRPHCSCGWDEGAAEADQKTAEYRRKLISSSFALIGSSKYNYVCRALMKRIEELVEKRCFDVCPPVFKLDESERDCSIYLGYLGAHYKPLSPTSTDGAKDGDRMTDYALLMRLPNLLSGSGKGTILLLGGCKMAAQIGLTRWISDPDHLIALERQFPGVPCCAVFQADYIFRRKFGPKMEMDWFKILPDYSREIKLKPEVLH